MDGPDLLSDLFQVGTINGLDLLLGIKASRLGVTWPASRALSDPIRGYHVDMWNPLYTQVNTPKVGDMCHVLLPCQHHHGPVKSRHVSVLTST
jgi:hypothetical protein